MAVGADAVVVPFEFAHELACAVVDGDEVACAAVAVAHEGDGGGQGVQRVLCEVHACDPPAVVGAPQSVQSLRVLAAMDALVQQPVAPACAVAQRDQAACGDGVLARTVAGLGRGAVAVVVELAAPEAVDLGMRRQGPSTGSPGAGPKPQSVSPSPLTARMACGLRTSACSTCDQRGFAAQGAVPPSGSVLPPRSSQMSSLALCSWPPGTRGWSKVMTRPLASSSKVDSSCSRMLSSCSRCQPWPSRPQAAPCSGLT